MISNYLQILQESMERKLRLLTEIEEKSKEESAMLKCSNLDIDSIDRNMDEKTELIQEVLKLDDGFEHLYERIKEDLDLESIAALNNGMDAFRFNILFSSHDHQLTQTVANRIIDIRPDGTIIDRQCSYDEYMNLNQQAEPAV